MTTAKEWLEEIRGLDLEGLVKLGVRWGPSQAFNGAEAVAVPYIKGGELKTYKVRRVGPRQDHERPFDWMPRGATVGLFNGDVLRDKTLVDIPVIITEGEFDALAIMECGFPRTVSVPHGAASGARYVFDAADQITGKVIIAGDADADGMEFVRAAAAALDGKEVRYCVWPDGCKDANDVLAKYGARDLSEAINAARLVHPETPEGGLICGFTDAPPPPPGLVFKTGDALVDKLLCFHTGFPTIVTGSPASGKSTFITWALWRAGKRHGIRNGVCLMETPWPDLLDQLARMETGWPLRDLSAKAQDELREELDGNWRMLLREDASDVATDLWWIREMMRVAATRDGCKTITFDPWNELEHRLEGAAITDYVNSALTQMRQWAERFGVALIVVAHPTKMQREAGGKIYPPTGYDIAGSAAWFNKAAIGITVHRQPAADGNGEFTRLINWKSKFQQKYDVKKGYGDLEFDEATMVYRRLP